MNDTSANLDAVAVIGMAGKFPGAADIAQFWRNLAGGVETVTFFSRAELAVRGVAAELLDDPQYVRAAGRLDGIDLFDAEFFGMPPREAEITDPQHRVFLECAWEALEDSGYDAEAFDGAIGVYAGAGLSTYLLNNVLCRPEVVRSAGPLALQLGNNKDYVPLRVSYKLRLRGPSVNVNTACSSSLVAVHMACQSLLDRQCDLALAGGVGIQVPQEQGYLYAPNGILSPDGHCRSFDARAQGTVSGNGAGIVVLKRLAEAVADRDTIRAVILGSAINNDGGGAVGFTAPSVAGQASVIGEALSVAAVDPDSLGHVEAHGTGTSLGDPIEVAALTQAFRSATTSTTARVGFCALGSVKSNMGHLDEAAGVAGLIKTVLALENAAIPPSLHFEHANPETDLARSPFYVPTSLVPWPPGATPRRAAVSSFGIGGTNAHVVLEEAPPVETGPSRPWQLLLLSARSDTALDAVTSRLAALLRTIPDGRLADAAYTLHVGRKDFSQRRMIVCRDRDDCLDAIAAGRFATEAAPARPRPVAFMFPGQGSQYPDMGHGLYRSEPKFRAIVDECSEWLVPLLGFDLRTALWPAQAVAQDAKNWLDRTAVAQPALFTIEYAMARLLIDWGIHPAAMCGHSIGEYVAACVAGVFSWQDALRLVAERGRLMQAMPAGGMLAVELGEAPLLALLGPDVTVALANAPSLTVVAGTQAAIDALERFLSARGVGCRRLHTSHAFHSSAMDPVLEPFAAQVRQVALNPPAIPYISNVTGTWITAAEATDPAYWARHLRAPVRFTDGVAVLLQDHQALVELGPGQSLGALVRRHAECSDDYRVVATMRHPNDLREDAHCLMEAVGRLWLAGACRKPAGFYADERRRRIALPTYPFERRRFWLDAPEDAPAAAATPDRPVPDQLVEDWFHIPTWQRQKNRPGNHPARASEQFWLIFCDRCGLGEELAGRMRHLGRRVVTVTAGAAFACEAEDAYTLDPRRADDYRALFEALATAGETLPEIAHLLSVTRGHDDPNAHWDAAQAHGFESLLFLAQVANRHARADRLRLHVVSSHMQAVIGNDIACPEKATLLGSVRVLPLEFPGAQCRSIDMVIQNATDRTDSADVDALLAALLAPSPAHEPAPVLAIRDGAIWQQSFTRHRLPVPAATPGCLREGGVYLITGGLGAMGLAMARDLARTVHARLVLVGRRGLPAIDFDPAGSVELVRSYEAAAEQDVGLLAIDADARLSTLLRAYCAALIGRYFRGSGVTLQAGWSADRATLLRQLKVVSPFEGFIDFLLACLAEDGIVVFDAERIVSRDASRLADASELRRSIEAADPRFAGLIRFLDHCTSRYGEAVAGKIPAATVLYPDGTPALMDEYARHTPAYTRDGVYLRTAARLLGHIATRNPGRRLRILEVGGGSGGLTRAVLPALDGQDVEYVFTDLAPSFVRQAQLDAAGGGIDWMRFGLLDIARDPAEQGFADAGFDIVLAYNVVHATPDIDATLGNLRRMLAPGGTLMLVETTRLRRWDEMVWGLTEGWWHFTDRHLRAASPLLDRDAWQHALRRAKFGSVTAYPALRASDVALFVAQRPAEAGSEVAAALAAIADIRAAGGEAHVIRADIADTPQLRTALAEAHDRFGPLNGVIHTAGILGQGLLHGMTREAAAQVFAAKAKGLLVLDRLLGERGTEPDFMVLCSSLAALTPIAGQAAYCAANAFLDAFAAYRSRSGRGSACSIDWGFWQELGMMEQARMPAAAKQAILDEIRTKGQTGAGIEAFRRILSAGPPWQIVVTPDPLDPLLAGPRPVLDDTQPPQPDHPWLHACISGPAGVESYVAHLDSMQWMLDEHRPFGTPVWPGTGFLELARAAVATRQPGRPVELSDVYFLAPLLFTEGERREVRTILTPKLAGFAFVVVSRAEGAADEWLEHARGEISLLAGDPPPPLDLQRLAQRCQAADIAIDDDISRDPFAQRVRGFTPHWRCFQRLRLGDGEGLATLRLASTFAAETAALGLHPALSDVATGFMSMVDGFETGVPFCYRRVRIRHALPPFLYSLVRSVPSRLAGERSYDATLLDQDGTVLVEVDGFTLKQPVQLPTTAATAREEHNFFVAIDKPGSLATLGLRSQARRSPGRGEVEIEVEAAGINFIEVLYALGMLPEPPGGDVRFGLECAGTIVRTGADAGGLQAGDAVFGFAPGALARYAVTSATTVARIPAGLTPAEAATLPAAFTTAYYALITRGRLRRGERVLIHAAAGGVGLAAVNIATWRGADILATAGSPAKRDHLRSLGIRHVADSRSLDFVRDVLDATGGSGVNVVLNSLSGAFIPAGLSVLARHGRFLELGKRDILADTDLGLAPFEKHLSFTALDVGTDLPEFERVWRQVVRGIARGAFRPLPRREFPIGDLAAAFEHMAQAAHIGKVVAIVGGAEPVLAPVFSGQIGRRTRGRPLADILPRGIERAPVSMPGPNTAAPDTAAKPTSRAVPVSTLHPRPALAMAYRAPDRGAEAGVAAIWEELLGVSGIGADDNFFELRGDSLLAAQVTSRLHAAFEVQLPLSSVFEYPTPAGLSARIEQMRASRRELATAPAAALGEFEVEHEL